HRSWSPSWSPSRHPNQRRDDGAPGGRSISRPPDGAHSSRMSDQRPDWLFVDGSSFIFRAFHGVPRSVRAPDGHLVNAVRGFMETLVRLIGDRRPRRLAVADDADWRPAWRVELIPGYKAHRTAEPVPPELEPQMPVVREFLA